MTNYTMFYAYNEELFNIIPTWNEFGHGGRNYIEYVKKNNMKYYIRKNNILFKSLRVR